jgi:hypothetical protein
VCRAARCDGDTAVKEAACTGDSAYCPAETTEACERGACNAGVCVTGGGVGGGGGAGGGGGGGMQDGQEVSAIFKPGCGCRGADGGLLWGLLALGALVREASRRRGR